VAFDHARVSELPAEPTQSIGAGLGRYRLIASLGHGGMADVFLGVAEGPVGFTKLQVIKRLRPNLAEDPELLTLFLDEARLAARLNHPNVVQTNEVGEQGGGYFIAMEYLDGQPLNRILQRTAGLGAARLPVLLRVLADALAGLHHAHELCDYDGKALQVVHRDVSPHNLFVTYDGQTKVVDFGIAKAATRSSETRAGVLRGKVSYMSPEQARFEPVDRRADLFSAGAVLWEILAGQKLWRDRADTSILAELISGEIPDVADTAPGTPRELAQICRRALAPEPADRYATAAQMRADLLTYLEARGHIGAEQVAAFLAPLFADKRAEMKAVIERQLSGLAAGGGGVSLVDIAGLGASSTGLPRVSVPAPGMEATPPRPPSQPPASTSSPVPVATSAPAAPMRASRRGALLISASAAVALGATLMFLDARSPAPGAGLALPGERAALADASLALPARRSLIALRVRTVPADARVFVDDALLPTGPLGTRFPEDGAGHHLRVEAPGYVTQRRIAVFDQDLALEITLEAEAAADKVGAPARSAPAVEPMRIGPAAPPKRKLDATDPWAQ
jgi:serine/threonine-protein kinase